MPKIKKTALLELLSWSEGSWDFWDRAGCLCAPTEWGASTYDTDKFRRYFAERTGYPLEHYCGYIEWPSDDRPRRVDRRKLAELEEARARLEELRAEARHNPGSETLVLKWQTEKRRVAELEKSLDTADA